MTVSSALTWRSEEKGALGAASAVRAGSMSDQSVLLMVIIVVDCDGGQGSILAGQPSSAAAAPTASSTV